jgi:hypothetical protein
VRDFKLSYYGINRKVAGSIPDEVIFLNLPNPSGSIRLWGLLSLSLGRYSLLAESGHEVLFLTEMSSRNIKIIMFLRSKVRRVCRADNLTAICKPIV